MKRSSIKTKEPFEGLFPVENHILQAVIEDMKANGYDPNFPVRKKEAGREVEG